MGALQSFSDSELADRLIKGDRAALEEIYLRFSPLLYEHARKMLRDQEKAKDVVHDLFANLLNNAHQLNIQPSIKAYLYRSVRNQIINLFHKDANRHKYEVSLKAFYEKGNLATEEAVLEKDLERRIENALADLPSRMREIFLMSRIDELSYKEIALHAQVSEETVRTQIKRALRILRGKLNALFFFV